MYLNTKDFIELDEKLLSEFLEIKIKENMYLDYKANMSSVEKGKTHKEFLKDVTAFANANGGNILIGVKEPSNNMTIEEQMIGIENANEWSQDLERLTVTSIDPRISGLKIKPIPLSNGKSVIAIHIPPSLSRPHMVNYDKHRTFYMRHSESSFPMSTHEIRNSIMTSLTIEEKVKEYLKEQEYDFRKYFLNDIPTLLIQAMPLIPLESSWDTFNEDIIKVVRGDSNNTSYRSGLRSLAAPRVTINGVLGSDNRDIPNWQSEIHRNGYVSLYYRNQHPDYQNQGTYIIHSGYTEVFDSFMSIIEDLLIVTKSDVPYIISCKYTGAKLTRMYCQKTFFNYSKFYEKEEIIFPFHYRSVGESFEDIGKQLIKELFNAYGFKDVID